MEAFLRIAQGSNALPLRYVFVRLDASIDTRMVFSGAFILYSLSLRYEFCCFAQAEADYLQMMIFVL